jgi:hypothetical protein
VKGELDSLCSGVFSAEGEDLSDRQKIKKEIKQNVEVGRKARKWDKRSTKE